MASMQIHPTGDFPADWEPRQEWRLWTQSLALEGNVTQADGTEITWPKKKKKKGKIRAINSPWVTLQCQSMYESSSVTSLPSFSLICLCEPPWWHDYMFVLRVIKPCRDHWHCNIPPCLSSHWNSGQNAWAKREKKEERALESSTSTGESTLDFKSKSE